MEPLLVRRRGDARSSVSVRSEGMKENSWSERAKESVSQRGRIVNCSSFDVGGKKVSRNNRFVRLVDKKVACS